MTDEKLDKTEFDSFVEASNYGNLLQTTSWARVKSDWESRQIMFYSEPNHELVACASLLIKRIFKKIKVAYIPRGPVVDYSNPDLVVSVYEALKNYAKKEKIVLVKCDPSFLFDRNDSKQTDYCMQTISALKAIGYSWTGLTMDLSEMVQPRFQANKYLTDQSVTDYKKHAKRLKNNASKKGVEIISGLEDEVKVFSDLVVYTEQRKNIRLRNFDYFKKIKDSFGEKAVFYFAQIDISKQQTILTNRLSDLSKAIEDTPLNQKNRLKDLKQQELSVIKQREELSHIEQSDTDKVIVAGVLGIHYGSGVELLYASMDDRFKQFYPQYLLDMEIFNRCYQKGLNWANMGGVEGNLEGGLSTFKLSFNPTIEEYIGEFNLIGNKSLYYIGKNLLKLKKHLKRFKK
ncbi:peptidoglycan bridge formation glycyltransferase FemA/FemB family protein [Streptococcus hongkongensis]